MAYIGSRKVCKFLCPFVSEFDGDDVFMTLVDLFLRRLQILAGHAGRTRFILEFHDSRLTNGFDGFFRIFFTR